MKPESQAESTRVDIVEEIQKTFARLREMAEKIYAEGGTIEWSFGPVPDEYSKGD